MVTQVRPSIRRLARIVLAFVLVVAAWHVWENIEVRRAQSALSMFGDPPRPVALGRDGEAARLYAAAAIASVDLRASAVPSSSMLDVIRRRREAMLAGDLAARADVQEWTAVVQDAVVPGELIARGSLLEFAGFAPGTDFNLRASGVINAARLAEAVTLQAIADGDVNAVARSILARIQFLRAFENENLFLISQRSVIGRNIATDVALAIGARMLPDETIQVIADRFGARLRDDELAQVIDREAHAELSFATAAAAGRTWQHGAAGHVLAPLLLHRATKTLAVLADARRLAREPWPGRYRDLAQVSGPSESFDVAAWTGNAAQWIGSFEATVRTLRTAIAVERYRRVQGRLPSALPQLRLDAALTRDPFSGDALKYEASPAGFAVYSVGADGRDDGGRLEPAREKGRAPGVGPFLDTGVRVTFTR